MILFCHFRKSKWWPKVNQLRKYFLKNWKIDQWFETFLGAVLQQHYRRDLLMCMKYFLIRVERSELSFYLRFKSRRKLTDILMPASRKWPVQKQRNWTHVTDRPISERIILGNLYFTWLFMTDSASFAIVSEVAPSVFTLSASSSTVFFMSLPSFIQKCIKWRVIFNSSSFAATFSNLDHSDGLISSICVLQVFMLKNHYKTNVQ